MRATWYEYTLRRNGHMKRFQPKVSPPRHPRPMNLHHKRNGGRHR